MLVHLVEALSKWFSFLKNIIRSLLECFDYKMDALNQVSRNHRVEIRLIVPGISLLFSRTVSWGKVLKYLIPKVKIQDAPQHVFFLAITYFCFMYFYNL